MNRIDLVGHGLRRLCPLHGAIDVFARRIVGWRVSTSMSTQFGSRRAAINALDQAVWQRKPHADNDLIHHSDRGSQYLSIKYTERLAEAKIDVSVGTVGDSYDNATHRFSVRQIKPQRVAVERATRSWLPAPLAERPLSRSATKRPRKSAEYDFPIYADLPTVGRVNHKITDNEIHDSTRSLMTLTARRSSG